MNKGMMIVLPRAFAEIPTSALLVDVPAMERNIHRMAEFFASGVAYLLRRTESP